MSHTKPWSKREVLTYLDRILPALDKLNHFEMLDIPRDADAKIIQSAFHAMAARVHPDRHRNTLTPEQYERLIVAYARIAEAYRILRLPKSSTSHAKTPVPTIDVSAPQQSDASLALLSPKAQQLYRRSIASQRTGDVTSAILNLRMALAKHPHSDFLQEALRNLQKCV